MKQGIVKHGLIAALVIACAGCSSLGGNASYVYTRKGNDCSVRIESGRNVEGAATARITDCNVDIGTGGGLSQGRQAFTLSDLLQIATALQAAKLPSVENNTPEDK